MILQEALAITLVSGYLGLVRGGGAGDVRPAGASRRRPFFRQPDVDIGVGLAATGVLVVAGMLAGSVPGAAGGAHQPHRRLRVE